MDVESLRALLVGDGASAVRLAVERLDAGADLLVVSNEVRRAFPELSPSVAAAAITQADLRRRARVKFGPEADCMWFTRDGVEQATRAEVATHRATRFAALNGALGRPAKVADLCCGIGGDLRALAAAGCDVTGFDLDPLTALVAQANIAALNIEGTAVECLDVETLDRAGFDAAFLDPARRHEGRRTFDVRAYSPPWRFVLELVGSMPAAVKVAPGIPHELIPDGIEAEWVSFRGELKEAVLWSGAFVTTARKRATVLPAGAALVDGVDHAPAVGAPRRYLYEPDPAVVRAHLVGAVAEIVGGVLLDPTTAYITSDSLVSTPFARPFEIVEVMPFSLKRLRQSLRARGIGAVTIMKRGSAVDVERLRRDLKLSGDGHLVVVLALVDGRHQVVLARPVTRNP